MITVIDDVMGAGKTTYAINHMNTHRDKRYLYVTPYLNEDRRIREACPAMHFKMPPEPEASGMPKSAWVLKKLCDGENVCTSHSCLRYITTNGTQMDTIRALGYTLVIDEEFPAVEEIKIQRNEAHALMEGGLVEVDADTGMVRWRGGEYDRFGEARFSDIKKAAQAHRLFCYDRVFYVWVLPPDLLTVFADVLVMTFRFKYSVLRAYFDAHGLEYTIKHIGSDGELIDGERNLTAWKRQVRALLTIYDGRLNAVGDGHDHILSKSWVNRAENRSAFDAIVKNAVTFMRTYRNIRASNELIWTCYSERGKKCGRLWAKYKARFVPCNAKATNEYRTATTLIYMMNMYQPPVYAKWARHNGVSIDADGWALNAMLQWIWRSAIRDGNPVEVYLPSPRMRRLLTEWLYAEDIDNLEACA